jgi:hypothetical protein
MNELGRVANLKMPQTHLELRFTHVMRISVFYIFSHMRNGSDLSYHHCSCAFSPVVTASHITKALEISFSIKINVKARFTRTVQNYRSEIIG